MNNNHFDKNKKRSYQKAKVLFSRPDFQNDVLEIRKNAYHPIPDNGFKDEIGANNLINEMVYANFEYFSQDGPFEQKIKALGINNLLGSRNTLDLIKYKQIEEEMNNTAPLNNFKKRVEDLIIKYKLAPKWQKPLEQYVLLNDINKIDFNTGIEAKMEIDKDRPKEIHLIIDGYTTLDDIKSFWPKIKEWQKKMPHRTQEKFQPLKKFELGKECSGLQEQGKKENEIADIINEKYSSVYTYPDIARFIKRYKDKINKN